MKTILVLVLTVAFYAMLGTVVPALSNTALVVVPVAWLGGIAGWASLGALTYKGIASLCLLGYLSKRIA